MDASTLFAAFRDADNRAAVGRARFMALMAFVLSIPFGWLDTIFSAEMLAGGYRKKYLRATSRLVALSQAREP